MRIVKLGLISVVAFGLLIWGFTLLFPGATVLSRAANMAGRGDSLQRKLTTNYISYRQWLLPDSGRFDIRTSDIPFYESKLFNMEPQPNADTLFFEIRQPDMEPLQGGIGFYQLSPDSVTTQLFYVIHTPWYKPWNKLRMMMADRQIGPQMEDALQKLRTEAQR